MKSRWKEKNVEIEFLVDRISSFFLGKDFSKKKESIERDTARVLTYTFEGEGRPVVASVIVRGSPNDFEIEFVVDRKAETVARLGILSTLFGSGFYLRGRLENFAHVERLEGDFWDYVNEEIRRMSGDAKA